MTAEQALEVTSRGVTASAAKALFALMFNVRVYATSQSATFEAPYLRLHGKGGNAQLSDLPSVTSSLKTSSQLMPTVRSLWPQAHTLRRALPVEHGLRPAQRLSLRGKRIHPHSLRQAIHLLKAGVDFATISQWHATLIWNYTKRQALAQVFPDVMPEPITATTWSSGCEGCGQASCRQKLMHRCHPVSWSERRQYHFRHRFGSPQRATLYVSSR